MEKDIQYIINELGEERSAYNGAVSPPLMASTNYCFTTVAGLREAIAHEMDVPFYTRGHNPTVAILRKKIAALEGAEECLMFSSGSAAVSAAVMNCVAQGEHVVCVQKPYSWTAKLLNQLLAKYGVTTTYVDGTNPENYRAAIQANTKLFILESPNSMTFELQDIAAVCAIAKAHNIRTVMDNSYATPLNQNPIAMGVDIVAHSATKYLNGHSDVVAGVVCSTAEICKSIFANEYMTLGATQSAHDAWLILRGLRTLPLRIERSAKTTPQVVQFLEQHPKVEKVYYPFSPSHPQYDLAQKQMKRPGGMFSVCLKAQNIAEMEVFCNHLQRFLMATSWGGYESLIYPICVLHTAGNYASTTLPWNMIRVYIGLEDAEVLIADLSQALSHING